jgi:AraC family transcriptional regulator, transcriptional activator of pobA
MAELGVMEVEMAKKSVNEYAKFRPDRTHREDVSSAPFRSYALERSSPRFHIRRVGNTQRLYPAHKHDYFQILIYMSDAPALRIGLKSQRPQPGSIYFIAPMVPHQIRMDRSTRCVVIYFDLDFLRPSITRSYPVKELARVAPELMPFVWQDHVDFNLDRVCLDRVERSIASMIGQCETARICSPEIIRAELSLMLGLLCQDHEAEFAEFSAKLPAMGRDSSHMRHIADFIGENYARGPSIGEAANAARLSKSRLCALIRQYTGTSFQKLIREMRIDEARERLVLTDDTITQVAYAVGYNDDKYFLRAFKNSVGMTPSAYRLKRAQSDPAGTLAARKKSNPAKHSSTANGKSQPGVGAAM